LININVAAGQWPCLMIVGVLPNSVDAAMADAQVIGVGSTTPDASRGC
jgi:hypothetical protein